MGFVPFDRVYQNNIEKVEAKPGTYKTGQIVPIKVTYDKLVVHSTPSNDNNPHLLLRNGQVVHPAHTGYSKRSHLLANDFETEPNVSDMGFIGTYQAIVQKNMKPEDLYVVQARDLGNVSYFYAYETTTRDYIKYYEHRTLNGSWNQGFSNNPEIKFETSMSDALVSLTVDKTSYKVGEEIQVTLVLDHLNGAADWLIDGDPDPEELSKRIKISIGDKERGLIQVDWKREHGIPVKPYTLVGTYKVTDDIFDLMTESNKAGEHLRAKVYYLRDEFEDGEDLSDFMLWRGQFAYFTIQPIKFIEASDLQIQYPGKWLSGEANLVMLTDPVPGEARYRQRVCGRHVQAGCPDHERGDRRHGHAAGRSRSIRPNWSIQAP